MNIRHRARQVSVRIFSIILLLLFCHNVMANERRLSFKHLSVEDGLSSMSVNDIWLDPSGVVWIATGFGLDCYDGNTIRALVPPYEIHQGNPSKFIRQLAGSNDGILYVLYGNKIGVLNTRSGEFRLFFDEQCSCITYSEGLWIGMKNNLLYSSGPDDTPQAVFTLPSEYGDITAIHRSEDGRVWIGSECGKLSVFNQGVHESVSDELTGQICRIYTDSRGTVWVGSMHDGVLSISKDGTRARYNQDSKTGSRITSNFVRDFCEDERGNIWIGTFTGLNCLNTSTGVVTSYNPELERHDAISHSSIWAVRKDHLGTIWVATYYGGVNYFNPEYDIYNRYPVSNTEGNGLSSYIISKVIADNNGNVWIATEGGGLNKLDGKTGRTTWYNTSSPAGRRLSENNIKDMLYDGKENALWIGLHLGGVNRLDLKTGHVRSYCANPLKDDSLPSDDVLNLSDYGDSLIVIMKHHACIMDKTSGRCRPIRPICNFMENGRHLRVFFCKDNNDIWIGMRNPLSLTRLSPPYTTEIEYNEANSKGDFYLSEISGLMQDSSGKIWLASAQNGFYIYDYSTDSFTSLGGDISLKGYHHMVESSATGNIICSSEDGFIVFNPVTHNIRHYGKENGFPLKNPLTQCITIFDNSEIFIGGHGGLVSVSEKDLDIPKRPYKLFFSSLSINGEKIEAGSDILPESILYTRSVTLPSNTRSLELSFSSSNHIAAKHDIIEYNLEGFDNKWRKVEGQRKISYTNLPAGSYRLHLRPASDALSEVCSSTWLDIRILPPWWATWYAILFYLLLIVITIIVVLQFYTSKVKMRENVKFEKERAAGIENLNQAKLRFFTNISHEIRTPLTIIIAEIESLIQQHNFSPSMYRKVLGIYKNSLSLRELISELMEFRKQEQGNLKIRVAPHNIMFFINEFYLLFSEYASSKKINLSLTCDTDRLEVWYDQIQMQKVLNNILSNSVKFTPEGGLISIRVYSTEASAVIEISDTGCGIPEKDIKNIFDRFYQVEYSSELNTGTGIGLALAQGIIRLHSGTIEVESNEGKGSLFRIILPLGYSHFSDEQINKSSDTGVELHLSDNITITADNAPEQPNISSKAHTIVIAEDNQGILDMLVGLFSPFYEVIPVTDGTSALSAVRKHMPSLVLSDVLMPGMNGTQLCKTIKNDPTLCHIPVVLLTARVEVEHNVEGLRQGADDYIAKPFNSTLLLSRCNNLVNSRIMLQEKYGNPQGPSTWMRATNRMDSDFIDKITELVVANLDNASFDITMLIKSVGISRTGFFKKLKAITGQTPTEFIQTIRLKRGAELLRNNPDMNIGEISDMIGFNTPKYFSRCFKEYFGKSPLVWRKENTEIK